MLVILHLVLKSNVQKFQKFGFGKSSENGCGVWFSMGGCAGSQLGLLSWQCTNRPAGCSLRPQWPWLPVRGSDLGLPTHSLELVLGVSYGRGHSDCPNPQHKHSHLEVFRENGGVLSSGSISPPLPESCHCFDIHFPGDLSRLLSHFQMMAGPWWQSGALQVSSEGSAWQYVKTFWVCGSL